jgi:NADH-quinone oxidoreductase subunit B
MAKDGSASFIPTRLDHAVKWAQKNSLWPMPFGTSCCGIEMMSTLSGTYDLSRFGSEVVRFSPRQADMLLVAGTITTKMAPVLRQIYDQMLEPKWVIAMGACSSSGGIFNTYSVLQGIDEILPVDIYVPGCPPIPEGLIFSILKLQETVDKGLPRPSMHKLTREEARDAMSYRKVIQDSIFDDPKSVKKPLGGDS